MDDVSDVLPFELAAAAVDGGDGDMAEVENDVLSVSVGDLVLESSSLGIEIQQSKPLKWIGKFKGLTVESFVQFGDKLLVVHVPLWPDIENAFDFFFYCIVSFF